MPHKHVVTHVVHVVDPALAEAVKASLQLAKETDARSRVMFNKIHNLQQDIATLQSKLQSVISALVGSRESDHDKQALVQDIIFQNQTQAQTGSMNK